MTEAIKGVRDCLSELAAIEDGEAFMRVAIDVAVAHPDLEDAVCEIAERGWDEEFVQSVRSTFAEARAKRDVETAELAAVGRLTRKELAEQDFATALGRAIAKAAEPKPKVFISAPTQPPDAPQPEPPVEDAMAKLKQRGLAKIRGDEAEASKPAVAKLTPKEAQQAKIGAIEGAKIVEGPGDLSPFFASVGLDAEIEEKEVLVLNPGLPFENVQKIVSHRAWHKGDHMPTLRSCQKSFWSWDRKHWCEIDPETVRSAIWYHLNAAEKVLKGGKHDPFGPQREDIGATIDALQGLLNLRPNEQAMPGWFGSGRPEGDLRELVACQNGILHIPSRTLLPHTPKFWSANVLPYCYEPQARAGRFERFLEEVWPGDSGAQEGLLELFGLAVTDITKYQKMFMFVGPPRGGRGTIGRVLKELIGPENFVGTSLKAFSEPFGMESFVGKKIAVFSDAMLDGLAQRNLTTIAERLQRISGEDDIEINRKNAKYWAGKLNTRVIIFANELLRFQSTSGALAERFITFQMQQQFLGARQDPNLTPKLKVELPGILNLSLDALDRVRKRELSPSNAPAARRCPNALAISSPT